MNYLALALILTQPPAWPQFRGPGGSPVAPDDRPLPAQVAMDKSVVWKTKMPGGISSPCIWGDRIFLTSYDPSKKLLETLCLDRNTGDILWRQSAPATKIEGVYKLNSPASATPCTDGERVYVSFGSYGLLCYDFKGQELWRRPLPTPRVRFGTATSPVVVGNLLLLNAQGKDLHLAAFDIKSGEPRWTTPATPFPADHSVVHVWKHGDVTEAVAPGRGGLVAYDVKDGSRRWWIAGLSPESSSSPVLGDGLLYVASHMPGGDPDLRMKLGHFGDILKKNDKNGNGKLEQAEVPNDLIIFQRGGKDGVGEIRLYMMFFLFDKNRDNAIEPEEWKQLQTSPFDNSMFAVRPGGTGDIAKSHVVWQTKRGVPEVPSPVFYQGRIYSIRNGGFLACTDAKSGKEIFPQERLGEGGLFYASPVAGDGKLYVASDAGRVFVLKAGDRFELLSEADFDETIRATPALIGGCLYLRTAGHLYCFGKK